MPGNILVADDEPQNLELLEDLLTAEGYCVATAQDGRSCLEVFAHSRPDIVLLDVHMPDPDGFAVCRMIKADPETRLVQIGRASCRERV